MEHQSLLKQVLECFLRLTADRWGERSWGRFSVYCKFTQPCRLNLGQELLEADLLTLRSVARLNNEIISPYFLEVAAP